ncbi:ABC transporter substrate-binding protein, partial [Azotobacter chroococcum]|nr:ABC transporter substrate-binding protein [Azotobacter chroococcum]
MQNPFLAALLALAGLLSPMAVAAGTCERLVATGDPDQPPYLWRDPQNPGQLIGASADLLELLAKALELRIDLIRSRSRERAEAN